MPKKKGGRPTVMTPIVLGKLEEAFSMGCTDMEASLHAGIHVDSLYEYQKKTPGFADRKNQLKENPVLKARARVLAGFDKDARLAWDYLKNKKSEEFSTKTKTEFSGSLVTDILNDLDGNTDGLPKDKG